MIKLYKSNADICFYKYIFLRHFFTNDDVQRNKDDLVLDFKCTVVFIYVIGWFHSFICSLSNDKNSLTFGSQHYYN